MSSASYASTLLKRRDIQVFGILSIGFIHSINSDYTEFAVCGYDLHTPTGRKLGKGGVDLMWQRALTARIIPLDIDSDRICGIQYRMN